MPEDNFDFNPLNNANGKDETGIRIYDFKRPEVFTGDQIRALTIIHETFARLTTISLGANLAADNMPVDIRIDSVSQITYGEYIRGLSTPSMIAIINMEPLPGSALVAVDPEISPVILNILLGGKGEVKETHEPTDIEISIWEGLFVRMLGNVREAWYPIIVLSPRIWHIDTNPENILIEASSEMVLLITFKFQIGSIKKAMSFCIPVRKLNPVMDRLSVQILNKVDIPELRGPEDEEALFNSLDAAFIPVTVEIGRTVKTVKELKELKKGTIIQLDKPVGAPFDVFAGTECIAYGRIKYFEGTYGILITKIKQGEGCKSGLYDFQKTNTESLKDAAKDKSICSEITDNINIPIKAVADRSMMRIKELRELHTGTSLKMDHFEGTHIDIIAGGIRIGTGEVIVFNDNFGIRVTGTEGEDNGRN
jgi:flagellar motor switch protein FliM